MEQDIDADLQEEEMDEEETTGISSKIQTFPKLPNEESDSEKITRIEALLDQLCLRLGDEEDFNATYEQMIQFFNSLKSSTETLNRKLEREVDYTRSLEDKLKHKNLEYDNIQLRKYLAEAQGNMTISCEKFEDTIQKAFQDIQKKQDEYDSSFYESIKALEAKVKEITVLQNTIENTLNDFKAEMIKSSKNEYAILTNDCKNVLDLCNKRVGEIKNDVLSFLKNCSSQNQALIKKIPEQKREFSWKDVIVYILCGVCIVSMIVQLVV